MEEEDKIRHSERHIKGVDHRVLECHEQEFRCYLRKSGKQVLGFKEGSNVA